MKKKILDFSMLLFCISFVCWYVPVAFYNVYACDDYWFGTNVMKNGFWGNQIFYWINWEGSYTHTFFASFPHLFRGYYVPFYCNMFSLLLFWVALLTFIKTFTKISVKECSLISAYLLSFLYLFTNGDSEIRFWVCANITYIPEASFLLLFLSCYHMLSKENIKKLILPIFLLSFLIGGSKLTFILYAYSGMLINDMLYYRKKNIIIIFPYLILLFFVILNISAPGNYIRLKEEVMPNNDEARMSLLEVISYRIGKIIPYVFYSLLLFPIATKLGVSLTMKRLGYVLTFFCLIYILDSVIMYICFNDPGPKRVYFVSEIFITFIMIIALNILYNKWNVQKYLSILCVISSIVLIIINLNMFLEIRPSCTYSKKAVERDEFVRMCKNQDEILITKLPESHLILSYFSNDEGWLENVYLPYFKKECKVKLVETSK